MDKQEQIKKAKLYKKMFLTSTLFGAIGIYALYKEIQILYWIALPIWAILAVTVRVMIIRDRKKMKDELK
ncbi:MAG: hypothetical protein LBH29_01205 [Elusimicrobiota bacterium]|jgi:hypothetical protein|nr:hypothetical protein [Elusimicrobiota bacterium]